jgi:PucR-like helix-turn-helix protein
VGDQLPSPVLLQHVAVGGALELAKLTAAQEQQRRLGSDTLARLLDRRIEPQEARAQLAELELDLATSVLIAMRGAASEGALLHRRLAASRVSHMLLHRDQTLYLVLPGSEAASVPGTIGISAGIMAVGRVPDAGQEARWALAVAAASDQRAVSYDDESVMLPPRSPAEAKALVSRILTPLIRHDTEQGTDYVNTLRVILRVDRSWRDAAAELHIHKQTLGYRIRKIEQISGRGIARTDDIAEWWLALRAYDLLNFKDLR